jgi:ubiquinone/menaquinone biosynthesis C-methylase UbiE
MKNIKEVEHFWNEHPCDLLPYNQQDELAVFEKIEKDRYARLNKIIAYANFTSFKGKRVLEVGCGIGTDALQFAKSGAFYTGVDLTEAAISIAQRRFNLLNQRGEFIKLNAEELPFPDNYFDHVYSFGVIHHSPYPEKIISEIHRVLKPEGTITVMLYNRDSFYYLIEVSIMRKLFFKVCDKKRLLHLIFGLFSQRLSQRFESFRAKLEVMKKRCPNPATEEQWISMNTDDVFCPIARVYSVQEAKNLFQAFKNFSTEVWFIDKDNWALWLIFGRFIPRPLEAWLEKKYGWLRMIKARK